MGLKGDRNAAKNSNAHQRCETRRVQGRKRNYARILETEKARKGCTVTQAKFFLAEHQGKDRREECGRYKRFLDSGQEHPGLSAEDKRFLEEYNADGERVHRATKKAAKAFDEEGVDYLAELKELKA